MNTVSEEKAFKPLTIPQLKIYLSTEHNEFKKDADHVALDHHEEAHENQFCQFACDGATLLNKDKNQEFGMQFADAKFRHNNVIAFKFRKPLSHKAEKVAELA